MARPFSVAVCIPTFNQGGYVAAAVESALIQSGLETEVWISDDASTDGTGAELEKFSKNPRVHIHRQMANTGIACNAGWVISRPQTDYIVRLDSDDLLRPDYCRTLARLLEFYPQAAVAHCAVQEIDSKGARGRVRRLARKSGFQQADEALRSAANGYRVAANICMFRKEALESLSFVFQESLNFCEDWDLFARLAAAGWGNAYSSSVLAEYRVWRDAAGRREQRRAAEILGITHVLGSTLSDAWNKRSWPLEELESARLRFACAQSACLLNLAPGCSEYLRLRQILDDLAGNKINVVDEHLEKMRNHRQLRVIEECLKLRIRDFWKAVFYR